ncbi:MAG: hypothetical protein HQK84_09685 [Nitrospinae bacterium]|nr:hypothetical protein [Nitrospinota bacterium]
MFSSCSDEPQYEQRSKEKLAKDKEDHIFRELLDIESDIEKGKLKDWSKRLDFLWLRGETIGKELEKRIKQVREIGRLKDLQINHPEEYRQYLDDQLKKQREEIERLRKEEEKAKKKEEEDDLFTETEEQNIAENSHEVVHTEENDPLMETLEKNNLTVYRKLSAIEKEIKQGKIDGWRKEINIVYRQAIDLDSELISYMKEIIELGLKKEKEFNIKPENLEQLTFNDGPSFPYVNPGENNKDIIVINYLQEIRTMVNQKRLKNYEVYLEKVYSYVDRLNDEEKSLIELIMDEGAKVYGTKK